MRSTRIIIMFVIIAVVAAGCTSANESGEPDKLSGEVSDKVSIAEAYSRFGFELYNIEASLNRSRNVFISPVSVALALAMTAGGADGETLAQMRQALNLEDIEEDTLKDGNLEIIQGLKKEDKEVILSIANSIWLRKSLEFKKEFKNDTRKFFLAEVFPITTVKKINNWVSDETRGKISQIIDSISKDDIAYLINAIYFKGTWKKEFDPEKTSKKDFHTPGGSVKSVDMMKRKGSFRYLDGEKFKGVVLPYTDEKTVMVLLLPDEDSNLKELHDKLDFESWRSWREGFTKREGTVEIPRLEIEYNSQLKSQLSKVGMKMAFDPTGADFSRMCVPGGGRNVYIDDVLHKTYLKVDEKGTEAAGVTAVVMKMTSAMEQPEPFRLVFDRPYFLVIEDTESGLPLFMGSISDPLSR